MALTVSQLTRLLEEVENAGDGDFIVWMEGCDCYGSAGALSIDKDTGTVDIRRGEDTD